MHIQHITLTRLAPFVVAISLLGGCSDNSAATDSMPAIAAPDSTGTSAEAVAKRPEDTVASVGDEYITYSLLNTMLNSSAMVGLSVPALGTPERNQVIITLMDKAISANLLYLDAKQQGIDQTPVYLQDIKRFEDAVLASLYRDKHLYGDIQVSEEEIQEQFDSTKKEGDEMTEADHDAIESSLRNDKLNTLKTRLRSRIRDGVTVEIDRSVLDPFKDESRTDSTVVANADDVPVTWGEVKELVKGADRRSERAEFYLDVNTERQKRLDTYIDTVIMADKGRAAGLESDPVYLRRTKEYRKTHLINLHRKQLLESWEPSDEELKTYFEAHKDQITVPEMRKVQMVVLSTKEEAEEIKQKIESGEMTIYQAARDHSIDPNAKSTLGEMGWVMRGTGFTELDEFTFFQEPEVIGGPVESPAGWHLVKVQDVQDAQMQFLEEPQTRRETRRRYLGEKLDNYVIALRENEFNVAVYEDVLASQFQRESDFMAELTEKAAQEGSVTSEREAELKEMMEKEQ
ncbi:MAG TPA: peptidyl-prolyl cis-trans isomerase [Gammaproteobacteria bacterium]|nr:peptidyl-prolyl cis-trans isomerase [Gammaproteobacteria bacterium]